MRILFLCNVVPHGNVVSGAINVYHRIRLLAQRGHTVGLAAFTTRTDEPHIGAIRAMLHEMELVPRPLRNGFLRRFPDSLFPLLPREFSDWYSPVMRQTVGRMITQNHYDLVVAEFSVMGQYLHCNPFLPAVRRVISCHSCLTTSSRKEIGVRPYAPSCWRRKLALKRLQDYEFGMYRSADQILTLTGEERMDLLRYNPDLNIRVVPYGVDVDYFKPTPSRDPEESLVYTGYFAQEPNSDAFIWFVKAVWPWLRAKHPGLKFYVVGEGVTHAMRSAAANDPRIVITGPVDDMACYLARGRIFVCPIRMGTGFRGKILQAMAAGLPVVATTLAAEGIPAQNGQNIILADTPATMSRGIDLLLSDAGLRRSIAANARDLVVRRFAWSQCVDLFEKILIDLLAQNRLGVM
jgi:glycosyltransferase involved in cell wall biosynthesis